VSSNATSVGKCFFREKKWRLKIAGRTVSEARVILNSPSFWLFWVHKRKLAAFVNKKKIDESYALKGNDHLEFIQIAGPKC